MKNEKKNSVSPFALIAFVFVLVAVVTFAMLRDRKEETPQTALAPESAAAPAPEKTKSSEPESEPVNFRMPPYLSNVGNVSLEPVKDPATVSPAAQTAYVAVQKNPKLIAQLPCFCYCDRFGHKSLHDCFVTDHAENCDICMKEALQAEQLAQQGMPADQIRENIVAQFQPRGHDHDHPHEE